LGVARGRHSFLAALIGEADFLHRSGGAENPAAQIHE
jgi:hypothetical protein